MSSTGNSSIRIGSRVVSGALLALAYGFSAYAAPIVFGGAEHNAGYRYLLLLTATLLLLAAHGFQVIRKSQIQRLDSYGGGVRDVSTDVTMSVWEIFFGWLGLASALMFLYYAAPATLLSEWHPRIFLCIVVFLGATYHRALVFVYSTLPFVLTITLLDAWSAWSEAGLLETAAKLGFVALDLGLLGWAVHLTRSHGVFTVSELELPVGPGRIGGRLCAVIRSRQSAVPEAGYQLDLSCIRQFREGAGRSSGEVLFHFRKLVRGDLPGARFSGSSVPVEFDLPEAALASAAAGGARISWTLRATAQLPEADFGCAFETPVRDSDDGWASPAGWTLSDLSGAQRPVAPRGAQRVGNALVFRDEVHPNASSELITLACLLFWFQLMWLTTASGIDWSTWAMFAAGIGFLGVLLAPWIVGHETRIENGQAVITRRTPWGKKQESLPLDEIETIEAAPDGWRTGLVDATRYYRVQMTTSRGKRAIALSHFREKRLAEAVAEQVGEAIGQAVARNQAQPLSRVG
ncbi:MAG: hypothetical protein GC160_17535 [Acidobacteria bacterium]|nr:hypothetical protein [Acidobacteriota bacterium]